MVRKLTKLQRAFLRAAAQPEGASFSELRAVWFRVRGRKLVRQRYAELLEVARRKGFCPRKLGRPRPARYHDMTVHKVYAPMLCGKRQGFPRYGYLEHYNKRFWITDLGVHALMTGVHQKAAS